MVFVDGQQLESSFVVPQSAIESLTADGPVVTVRTRQPIRNRSGEVTRLSFRVPAGDPAIVTSWYSGGTQRDQRPAASAPASGAAAVSPGGATGLPSYEARHNHTFGERHGRLVVSATQLSYESIDNVGHSRRWEYASIRELLNPNPYEIEVKPFSGDTYKFRLSGAGMDPAAFTQLVDRVTEARAGR